MKNDLLSIIKVLKDQKDEDKIENVAAYKKYFETYFIKYPFKDYYSLSKLSYEDLIFSFILINNPYDFNKCISVLEKYKDKLFRETNLGVFLVLLNYVFDKKFKKMVDDLVSDYSMIRDSAISYCTLLSSKIGCSINDFFSFSDLIVKKPSLVNDLRPYLFKPGLVPLFVKALNYFNSLKRIKTLFESPGLTQKAIISAIKELEKEKAVIIEDISYYGNYLYEKYNQIVRDVNKEVKRINAKNKALDELIKLLNVNGEFTNIDCILELCPNEEIKALVIDYIIENNRQYNLLLLRDYEDFKYNSDENLTRLFKEYGYQYDIYSVEEKDVIKLKGYDKLENIFKKLKVNQIKLKERELLYLDEELLNKIIFYLNLGIFTVVFITKNILLLINTFMLVESNIEKLSNEGINMVNYTNSLDILFNSELVQQLSILKKYGLNIRKETLNINFLNDNNLVFKIDFLIEAGYYEQLKDSLDMLNYSLDELKRLKLKEQLNLNSDLLIDPNTLFLQTYFIDYKYLEILNSNNNYMNHLPESLESYKMNNYVLLINGVFVSIHRLINNLAKFEQIDKNIIWICILYNGYYTLEEIEKISKVIYQDKEPLLLVRR